MLESHTVVIKAIKLIGTCSEKRKSSVCELFLYEISQNIFRMRDFGIYQQFSESYLK